ncbi:RimK/LysX family protein [Dokdonella sp.]|uniref:ATP-dependent zinc protease family protein n=1 Tax=Dokdonella sp. TaxID=2291710 RepID=UPI002618DCA7|nr:RimK/LysX family protein [Dokdonella sp.]
MSDDFLPPPVSTIPCANLGWREWLALPALGIPAIKAKVDTGARSSALHVEELETFERDGTLHVRFAVRPRRRGRYLIECSAPVSDRRPVMDSGGHRSERWFIETDVELAGRRFRTEINLSDRGAMLFPMLLGRSALGGRFRVDPALSYSCPRPRRRGES